MNALSFSFLLLVFCAGAFEWKRSVLAIPFWILAEGAVRKWLAPGDHIMLYFLKDFLLAGAVARFAFFRMSPSRRGLRLNFLDAHLILLGAWCAMQMLNPSSPRILIGLMGIKVYLFYAAFIYLLPEVFKSREEVLRYLWVFALCSIPVLILGIVQFFAPPGTALTSNLGWNPMTQTTLFGGTGFFRQRVRISSTFAYLTEYSGYLIVLALLMMALLQMRRLRGKAVFYAIAALAVTNLLMTGSRGPVGLTLAAMALFLFLSGRVSFGRFLQVGVRLFWAGAISSLLVFIQFPDALQAFTARFRFETDIPQRLSGVVIEPWARLKQAGLFGFGIGTTHPATLFLVKDQTEWGAMDRHFEEEPGRVMLEIGLVGFLLFYGLRITLLLHLWKALRQAQDWDLKVVAVFGFLLALVMSLQGILFSHTHLVFYWFFAALTLWIPVMEQRRRQKEPDRETPP